MDKGSNLEQMYLAFFTVEFMQDYEECCKCFPTQFAYVYLYVFSWKPVRDCARATQ